jgi:hypothetical protein
VKRGVKYLGGILSGGIGMNDVHTICLYALLGNSTFTVMMKSVFNLDMDVLDDDFLVRLVHESKKSKIVIATRANWMIGKSSRSAYPTAMI